MVRYEPSRNPLVVRIFRSHFMSCRNETGFPGGGESFPAASQEEETAPKRRGGFPGEGQLPGSFPGGWEGASQQLPKRKGQRLAMAGSLIGTKKLLLLYKRKEETAHFQGVIPNLEF